MWMVPQKAPGDQGSCAHVCCPAPAGMLVREALASSSSGPHTLLSWLKNWELIWIKEDLECKSDWPVSQILGWFMPGQSRIHGTWVTGMGWDESNPHLQKNRDPTSDDI